MSVERARRAGALAGLAAAPGRRDSKHGGGSGGRGTPGAGVRRQGRAGLAMRSGLPSPQLGNVAGLRRLRLQGRASDRGPGAPKAAAGGSWKGCDPGHPGA